MSYLLDKKIQRNKIIKITFSVVILIILFYFRYGIFNGFSYVVGEIFSPVLVAGNSIGKKIESIGSYFISKNSLYLENQNLKSQISESIADRANYSSVVDENNKLKEILNRKNIKSEMTLATILSKPNQSLYDTIIIDVGTKQNIKIGNTVFALGNVPIGRVDSVYENYSKVVLFSSPGEKTHVIVSKNNISFELIGRGGGNSEMILPRDFILEKGDQVVLPNINTYLVAIVETIISDPRNPFKKALLASPVNIQELKFVEVEK